ncbi:MAG: hypothetical protein HYR60_27925 [Acidobacteria bacterium]|nr:hypothetical protein [Acidobacteriota bacterium]
MIVKLRRRNTRYPDLMPGQPYVVIGIEGDEFRILNDAGRPWLYPPRVFKVIDDREPADWVTDLGEDGERYAYPAPLNGRGFFEDFFEQKPKAVGTFWRIVNQRLATVSEVVRIHTRSGQPKITASTPDGAYDARPTAGPR